MKASTLSQYEFDRLMITLENSRVNWQPGPSKRVMQLAFEYIDECRAAGKAMAAGVAGSYFACRCLREYPRSAKARKFAISVLSRAANLNEAVAALTRVANMNGEHA